MILKRDSTAPHIYPAADWKTAVPGDRQLLLAQTKDHAVEVGIRRFTKGKSDFQTKTDCLCYVMSGSGSFCSANGEIVPVESATLVHFKRGWAGPLESANDVDLSYMTCEGGPAPKTPVLHDVLTASPLKDWGVIPTMIEGASRTAGILLSREANGRAESGIWTCTPGIWRCEVTSDECCHFLAGSCLYTHDSGDQIEIHPDTLAFFPCGWSGRCEVRETIRKVYLIR